MKAILTRGISASGKSSWAEYELYTRGSEVTNINRDDIRFNLFCNGVRDWSLYKFTKQREKEVTQNQHDQIEAAAALGIDVIISDTNINPKTVTSLTSFLESYGYEVEIKDFWIDVQEALKRDAKRENGVGYKVIMDQYKRYCELLFRAEYHKHKNVKPDAIIVDVDGTVADMTGVRIPFEWTKVGEDKPHQYTIDTVNAARLDGLVIIFLSGRDGSCMEDTHKWLNKYTEVDDFYLFMRSVGDMRKDTIVKKELFKKYVDNNFNVLYCIDDRPSVCRMWRYELGLKVLQVGDPYQEF
jgi:predicted kinase